MLSIYTLLWINNCRDCKFSFIYLHINKEKEDKRYIKSFIIQAIIEVVLYLPWIVPFLYRSLKSSGGFWIKNNIS